MVVGKLPVPGRPTIWMIEGQGPNCTCSRCGWGLFGHFTLIYPFSPLSPSLWETAGYRLKYCLKGPLNPKPTNQLHQTALFLFLRKPLTTELSSCCIWPFWGTVYPFTMPEPPGELITGEKLISGK